MYKSFENSFAEEMTLGLAMRGAGYANARSRDVEYVNLAREIDVDHFGVDIANATGSGSQGSGSNSAAMTFAPYISGPADGTAGFNITIIFDGSWTQALYDIFVAAADFYTSLIVGDLQNVAATTGRGRRATTTIIDDVQITASLTNIDGSGGTLGRAGPTSIHTSNSLTAQGLMEFDIADADAFNALGLFDDIVLHEMGHVLGFGTLWSRLGLILGDNTFGGELASAEHALQFNGDTSIDIETDGGRGTAFGHWDDATYTNELMTGFISNPNYFSYFSAASFGDLGYELNPNYRQVVDELNVA